MIFNLKKFRNDVGLKQADIGKMLGCGQSNVSAMEKDGKIEDRQYEILLKKYGEKKVSEYILEDKIPSENLNTSITIPSFAWDVIERQSKSLEDQSKALIESLKEKDALMKVLADSLKEKESQMRDMVEILKNQKGGAGDANGAAPKEGHG